MSFKTQKRSTHGRTRGEKNFSLRHDTVSSVSPFFHRRTGNMFLLETAFSTEDFGDTVSLFGPCWDKQVDIFRILS